jgi:hypothetical protein
MIRTMPAYSVQQGDCISSIAFQFGLHPDTLWKHPQNADLKTRRRDPNVLFPGDTVFVPDKTLRQEDAGTDQKHSYVLKGVPLKLKVRFLRNGKPLANQKYTLAIDGVVSNGTTDGDGNLECPLSPKAQSGTVTFPDLDEQHALNLGHLDPVDEVSGVQARLSNLGFMGGEPSGQLDDATRNAIAAFQTSRNVPSTGELDQPTKDALKSCFGS